MSRLRSQAAKSRGQQDVISLLRDEVIALCLRNYASVPSLEIDGIICISMLDSNEQQVVKIHKTFKSIVADAVQKTATSKKSAYPNIASILTGGSIGDGYSSPRESNTETETNNFQQDINTISDLLKASDAMIRAETHANKDKGIDSKEGKRSKRKRQQPKHRSDFMYDSDNTEQSEPPLATVQPVVQNTENSATSDIEGKLPGVAIKEEPLDEDYEIIYLQNSKDAPDSERSIPEDTIETATADGRQLRQSPAAEVEEFSDNYEEVKVKRENHNQDYNVFMVSSKHGDSENSDDNHAENGHKDDATATSKASNSEQDETAREWIYPETFDHEALELTRNNAQGMTDTERQRLYRTSKDNGNDNSSNVKQGSVSNDASKMALLDKFYQQGSMAHKGSARESEKRDHLTRTWIEMVKDNVNKYQAALMRTKDKPKEDATPGTAAGLLKTLVRPKSLLNTDHLKALLREPPLNVSPGPGEAAKDSNNAGSDRSRSCSVSPAPVVKIEVDEPQQDFGFVSLESKNQPPSGKLESRYPALFNQLQGSKSGQSGFDQSDSLVNRLPFISFQELFSQASPQPASSRMSESITKKLLEQAKVNPYPSKASTSKKTIWKWKKRLVKPKDNADEPSDNRQSYPKEKDKRPLGINMSAKRTFARKKQKLDENSDKEWTPPPATDEDAQSGDSTDGNSRGKITTRLSSGEKPRINFAELDNSDIEMEEDQEEDDSTERDENVDKGFELVSAFCKHNCGARFNSFTELNHHEDSCSWSLGGLRGADGVGPSGKFKCVVCGLDYNQEYRWQYHMVKVHGIAAEKAVLFR